jgi:hypothetical protein
MVLSVRERRRAGIINMTKGEAETEENEVESDDVKQDDLILE